MARPPRLLIIGGGSGAGKSTLAKWIAAKCDAMRPLIVSEDDYYHDHPNMGLVDSEQFNFDDIAQKDHRLLVEQLRDLKRGRTISKPLYDFATHRRLSTTESLSAAPLIILEGAHVLCNDAIRNLADLAVYIDTPDDIRLARRLARDIAERARHSTDIIHQYLTNVRPMHYKYVLPSRRNADLVIADQNIDGAYSITPRAFELEKFGAPVLERLQALFSDRDP